MNTQIAKEGFAEDLYYGQAVLTTARWFVIAGGVIAGLFLGSTRSDLFWGVAPFLFLMIVNFWLRTRQLAEKPANQMLVWLTSIIDLLVVTTIVLFFGDSRGLASPFFVFYYPLVLSFAFVMPPQHAMVHTGLTIAMYLAASLLVVPAGDASMADLFRRMVTLASVGVLAGLYWRVQQARRGRT